MADILWIVGMFVCGGIGFVFGVICEKWGVEGDFLEIRRDIFAILYDWGVHPDKKASLVTRINRVDKYLSLDEIRMEKKDGEHYICPADNVKTDDISDRLINAKQHNEWVV
jgi:hypothetical protein